MTDYIVLAFHKNKPEEVDSYHVDSVLPPSKELFKAFLEDIYQHVWSDEHLSDLTIKDEMMVLKLGGYVYMCLPRGY